MIGDPTVVKVVAISALTALGVVNMFITRFDGSAFLATISAIGGIAGLDIYIGRAKK